LTARPQNVVVYATSNRRHLIREFLAIAPAPAPMKKSMPGIPCRRNFRLASFGLTLTFEPADQRTYLKIVNQLAKIAGISLSQEDLEYRALQWATRHNGRSGRTARQFIDSPSRIDHF